MQNKTSYQTNFAGIKYSNNPLTVDINSFSSAKNVYLNKYEALISRPPIHNIEYAYQVYSSNNPAPIHLKLVSLYDLPNGGIIYVVRDTTANHYTLRYKSPTNVYSTILSTDKIIHYSDFLITQYKQYCIIFTVDGARVLNTSVSNGNWVTLNTVADIPTTLIQTGNEKLELPANQLTNAYKKQFVLRGDTDDTVYALPISETATISFANQSDITYALPNANEYTRDRILRKLNTSPNITPSVLISMVGEKIAVAHADRVDISLDYGETFKTIVYPTIADTRYKNTASLSDDGQCFFYVHSNGVYRYLLGTEEWLLIEVTLTPDSSALVDYEIDFIERQIVGLPLTDTIGANYCHFVNPEKFAFMLAYYRSAQSDWINVLYVQGLSLTNLFVATTAGGPKAQSQGNLLSSVATINNTPISIITDIEVWKNKPYLNRKLVKVVDNDTVIFNYKRSTTTASSIVLKTIPTHIYFVYDIYTTITTIDYIHPIVYNWTESHEFEINEFIAANNTEFSILIKNSISAGRRNLLINLTSQLNSTVPTAPTYDITSSISFVNSTTINIGGTSTIAHRMADNKYLSGTAFRLVTESSTVAYTLPLNLVVSDKVVISGSNWLLYNSANNQWYTNIPLLTNLTYNYAATTDFAQVPSAHFADQNLWLGMKDTLWIVSLVNDKLSALSINNNTFSKTITGIQPINPTSKAILFTDSITLCEELMIENGSIIWRYHPLKFTVGIRRNDSIITTNDGQFTIFPTKYGLAALTYQLDIAATEQAINYLTDDIKSIWAEFYKDSNTIHIIHHNTQLLLVNNTNQMLIYDFRTKGWYPLTFPNIVKIGKIQPTIDNYEILELHPANSTITAFSNIYIFNKEHDELYTYLTPYKDFKSTTIPWHLTSQILLLEAPNHYKNISQLIIDQVDSSDLKQSAYFTAQVFRQFKSFVKPAIELVYNIDTFAKITKKVNWWKVVGFKWQLENDANSSYPTQLRLYNVSIQYNISYEVK